MDLNAKIEARRKELAAEAEKAINAEYARKAALRKEMEIQEEKNKQAIQAEVTKRLAEQGIDYTASNKLPKGTIDAEIEKALNKAANERMTQGENTFFTVLIILGVVSFVVAWWLAVIFIIWAFIYLGKTTSRYKEQIIAEGKMKVPQSNEDDMPPGSSFENKHPNHDLSDDAIPISNELLKQAFKYSPNMSNKLAEENQPNPSNRSSQNEV